MLTLLAAGAAAVLSAAAIATDDVGPTEVIVQVLDERPLPAAPADARPADDVTIDTTTPPQDNPSEPPTGSPAPTVDECRNVPLNRDRPVPC